MIDDVREYLLNPPPGSAAERARDFGIDLTQIAENLALSPEERLRKVAQTVKSSVRIRDMREGLRRI
jgi:hypothetical protein